MVANGEPSRLRVARDEHEEPALADATTRALLDAHGGARVVLTHTRPEAISGILAEASTARDGSLRVLGYRNRGGTLDVGGMLVANRCTWAHALAAAAAANGTDPASWLTAEERAALAGTGDAQALMRDPPAMASAAAGKRS